MNNKNMKVNIGMSSLVLILIVLSLVVLCLLSITSARRDMVLATRNAEAVKEYYVAATDANEFIAYTYDEIKAGHTTTDMKADILMDSGLALRVELSKTNMDTKPIQIDTFMVYIKEDYEIDQSIPVWNKE